MNNNLKDCLAKYSTFFGLLSLCILIFACEKPIDNPELADRIYNDLLDDAKTSNELAEKEKKNLETIDKDIEAIKPGDNSRKNKMRQKFEAETKIESFNQKAQYFKLRAYKRKEYVLDTYPKYFTQHRHWPDAEEWSDYQASKRLQMANRNWDSRVPKLGKRIKAYNESAAAQYGGSKTEGTKPETPKKGGDEASKESGEGTPKTEKGE